MTSSSDNLDRIMRDLKESFATNVITNEGLVCPICGESFLYFGEDFIQCAKYGCGAKFVCRVEIIDYGKLVKPKKKKKVEEVGRFELMEMD